MVGGGARSMFWVQLLADMLEVPLVLSKDGVAGAALGAARLAWLADGGSIEEVCKTPAELDGASRIPSEVLHLRDRYARFRAAYPALRPLS